MGNPIKASIPESVPSVLAFIPMNTPSVSSEIQTVQIGGGARNLLVGTTEQWNSQPDLIGTKNVVYVYTDHETNEEGQPIPGFKVGDGLAYLIDLPFNDDLMLQHINNLMIHVTEEEKAFWNNKVTAYINAENTEELILTKN